MYISIYKLQFLKKSNIWLCCNYSLNLNKWYFTYSDFETTGQSNLNLEWVHFWKQYKIQMQEAWWSGIKSIFSCISIIALFKAYLNSKLKKLKYFILIDCKSLLYNDIEQHIVKAVLLKFFHLVSKTLVIIN